LVQPMNAHGGTLGETSVDSASHIVVILAHR
jgi:hypothetical protein